MRQTTRPAGVKVQSKSAVHEHVRHMLILERVCTRFHLVVQQLRARPEGRAPFPVVDEADVGDLLQALLTVAQDALQPEDWVPGYAGGRARRDFLLPLAHIVVTAKLTRSGWGAGELGAQLAADTQRYQRHPGCQTLVCFVYDPEGRLPDPRGLENELSGDRAGLTVRVIIAPHGP